METATLTHLFKYHYFRLMVIHDNYAELYSGEPPSSYKSSYYCGLAIPTSRYVRDARAVIHAGIAI